MPSPSLNLRPLRQTGNLTACEELAGVLKGRKLSLVGDSVSDQLTKMIKIRCSKPPNGRSVVNQAHGLPLVLQQAPSAYGGEPDGYNDNDEGVQAAWAAWERDILAYYASDAGRDVVSVVNFGLHYMKPDNYKAIVTRFLQAVSHARAAGAREIIWGETSTQHFMSYSGGYFTESKQLPESLTKVVTGPLQI